MRFHREQAGSVGVRTSVHGLRLLVSNAVQRVVAAVHAERTVGRFDDFPRSVLRRVVPHDLAAPDVVKEVVLAVGRARLLVLRVVHSGGRVHRANDELAVDGLGFEVRVLDPQELLDLGVRHLAPERGDRVADELPDRRAIRRSSIHGSLAFELVWSPDGAAPASRLDTTMRRTCTSRK